ncbi:MAG: UDP binding domain-containing protein, partial [Acidobacteriota bacterium]|nr:UDP binding domain-containing protein [Acidobacteriota bacterium]
IELGIVGAVIQVNDTRAAKMLEKIRNAMGGEVSGKTVALLGLSFKPNTDDLRESPAMTILDGLREQGARVRAYDPVAMEAAKQTGRDDVVFCEDEYDAARGADAVVVATEWNQFRGLDAERLAGLLNQRIIVDLRNVCDPQTILDAGFDYHGVGR